MPSYKLDLRKDPDDVRDFPFLCSLNVMDLKNGIQLPSINVVDHTPLMSPVKDQGNLGCHDENTEVLTNKGWKFFKDLDKTELIATINSKTHKLEYQIPSEYFEYDYSGEMYTLIHRDKPVFCITPNHKMYQRSWSEKDRELSNIYSFVEVQDIGWYSGLLNRIIPEDYVNDKIFESEIYKLPNVDIGLRKGAKNRSVRLGNSINLNKFMEFLGLYYAEGCCYYNKGSYRVEIAASDNNPRKEEVIRVVEALGFKYTAYPDRLTIRNKSLFSFLEPLGDVYTKEIPKWVYNLNPRFIELFLSGYILGDGRKEDNGGIFAWSVNKKLLDGIQELFLKIGKWSTLHDVPAKEATFKGRVIKGKPSYYLYIWDNKNLSIDRNKYLRKSQYSGKVYCVEVPNHILITRYNGYMLISGNSCVGFAVSAMKEWQERSEQLSEIASGKKSKKASKVYDLSEAWIYWNAKKIDGYPDEEGTSIRYAMKVLNKIGVPTEKAWPYSDQFKGEPSSWAKLIAKWSLVGSYYRIKSLDELLTALVKSPVVVGISCFEEIFRVDDTGVVPMPRNPQYSYGGHAICLCGFDKHKQRVKFKNSWSTNWGDKGYGYLSYDYLKAYMWDAWTCIDISVTSKMLKGPTASL